MTDKNLNPRNVVGNSQYLFVGYADGRVPTGAGVYTLFNSLTSLELNSKYAHGAAVYTDFHRYVLSVKNSVAGTIKAYGSSDGGVTWYEYQETAVAPASAIANNIVIVSLEPHFAVRIDWVNGGSTQTPFWTVAQALDSEKSSLSVSGAPASNVAVTNFPATQPVSGTVAVNNFPASQAVTAVQLPSSLGIKPVTGSLSTVAASDSLEHNAAALRAPLRNEIMAFPVTTASVTWNIPDGSIANQFDFRGKIIDFFADGSDMWIQFDTGTAASVDESITSTVTTVSGRQSATPAGNEPWPCPRGQWVSWPVPSNCQTFAIKGTVTATKLRTKLSQS